MENTQDIDKLFRELFEKNKDTLKRMMLKYCDNNDALAEDAVQQAFYNLYLKLSEHGIDYIEEYRAYLYMSARNILYNYHRDNAKLIFGNKSEVLASLDLEILSPEDEYVEAIDRRNEYRVLDELKKYNETWYYVLTEVYVNKRTQKEVAKELNISEANMYAMMRKVRKWSEQNLVEREGY